MNTTERYNELSYRLKELNKIQAEVEKEFAVVSAAYYNENSKYKLGDIVYSKHGETLEVAAHREIDCYSVRQIFPDGQKIQRGIVFYLEDLK